MPDARPRRRRGDPIEPPGPTQALEIAGGFLAARPRTRWEVARRLHRANTSEEVADATLARLEELGFIDDLAFARWWLQQRDRHAPRGRRMVEAELRQHGIGREVIEALREELAAEALVASEQETSGPAPEVEGNVPRTEEERARAALVQHLRGRPLPDDRTALQRLGMFLVRRGFDPDAVRAALRVPEDAGEADPRAP